uniref:sensor histidine kinase n=1 Tax=Neisseria dentiae TaxID=194197 RepID=UPI0035A16203
GVQECYEDVRELLLNFRTKISRKEFAEAVQTLCKRFEQQTQVEVNVAWRGDGPDLSSEQQLQFIFILQESLSNIRKHAQATQVDIEFDNRSDFAMSIRDNGKGFDTGRLNELPGNHVGLGIMRERALRINARLEIDSQSGSHTLIRLTLPQQERVLL